MEVVGAIASIVALIDVGKKLKHCVDEVRNLQVLMFGGNTQSIA